MDTGDGGDVDDGGDGDGGVAFGGVGSGDGDGGGGSPRLCVSFALDLQWTACACDVCMSWAAFVFSV